MKPSFLFVVSSFSYFGSLASGAAMQSDEHHEADALDTPTCSSTGNGENGTTTHEEEFEIAPGSSVLDYLDPALLEDEETLSDVRRSLLDGQLVVIRDAFIPEFADYVWNRLDGDDMNWTRIRDGRNSSSVPGHISYKHRPESLSPGLKSALDVLNHTKSRDFFSMISGRQCSETSQMWPSWYKPGDYSAPHTDYFMYRTVTFLWNLSKDWDPTWGGAFYWGSSKTLHDGFHYPTFNTLLLFLPSATSIHSVTPVLEEAEKQGKRFALGGWYNVDVDVDRLSVRDPLEEKYARREDRMKLTAAEAQWLVYNMSVAPIEDPDRKEKLRRLKGAVFDDCLHPSFESVTIIGSADDDNNDD